jgi:hypothetical protein
MTTQPPGTFKTNVNRSKTRKWAEAKNYSYDGDDWGGYDPYDEYGSYDDNKPSSAVTPRRNSFDAGAENTAFSSGQPQPPLLPTHITPTKQQSPPQNGLGIRRDYSQIAHVPQPLKTSPSPQPVRERFPARKSSLQTSLPSSPAQGSLQNAVDQPAPPALGPPNTAKIPVFIRPADIYKRMEEERLREQEAKMKKEGMPVRREEHQGFVVDNPVLARAIGASVAGHEGGATEKQPPSMSSLPTVNRVASGFGSDFWNASALSSQLNHDENLSPTTATASLVPAAAAVEDPAEDASHGLQDAVSQAFERQEDSSVPDTPISRDNSQSGYSSDTNGISPIMSRVPSAATTEAKSRLADARGMVPIVEESNLPGSPDSRRTSQPRKWSPAHSRHVSGESLSNSPAKTPQLEYTKRLSTPMSAENTNMQDEQAVSPIESPQRPHPITSVRVIAPSADYSRRESDIATDVSSSSPVNTVQAATAARAQFLQTHNERAEPQTVASPIDRTPSPVARRESPGPGRVRDLAGKYNELHTISRSSSAMSLNSQKSDNLSLRKSTTSESNHSDIGGEKVVESIEQPSPYRPDSTREPSFRPHLPGEWLSFAGDSRDVPTAQEATRSSGEHGRDPAHPEMNTLKQDTFGTGEDFDPTPSTRKQPLAHRDVQPTAQSSSVEAVKMAGEALGAALLSSFGQTHGTRDFAQTAPQEELPTQDAPRRSVGDVYLRPLMIDRTASSVASSVAPTPPPKDTPDGLNVQQSSDYFAPPTLRLNSDARSPASDYSPADLESDRLRREIERSLTPSMQSETSAASATAEQPRAVSPQWEKATAAQNTGLLGKRFSFEKEQGLDDLWGQAGDNTKRASYERPLSGVGLQVVNTNVSTSSESDVSSIKELPTEPIEEHTDLSLETVDSLPSPMVSPEAPTVTNMDESTTDAAAPVTNRDSKASQPRQSTTSTEAGQPLEPATPTTSTTRIPPFREILALKSVDERISTYNSARDQFASMDTGLNSWLSSTLSSRPEHAHIITDAVNKPASANAAGSIRYKQPGNIMKMARKGLSSVGSREPSGTYSADPSQPASNAERRNSNTQPGGANLQAKGKDLLHSAGMLGGKATVGAKGLFARAKGKLREGGSEKVD